MKPTNDEIVGMYRKLFPNLPLHFRTICNTPENITVNSYDEIPQLLGDNLLNDTYIVLNAVSDVHNRVNDRDITEIRYLLIDFDIYFKEKRQPTEQEYTNSIYTALSVSHKLKALGFTCHVIATGNGAHLYLHLSHKIENALDLAATSNVCKMFLRWLNLTYTPVKGEGKAFIDTVNFNPSRIARAPYSINNKYGYKNGRLSYIVTLETYMPCSLSDLTYFTGKPEHSQHDIDSIPETDILELIKFMDLRSDKLKIELPEGMNFPFHTKWDVEACPFSVNGDTHRGDASIIMRVDGTFIYKCFHESCQSENSTFDTYLEKHGVLFNPNHVIVEKYRYVKAKNDAYQEGNPDTPLTVRLKEQEAHKINLPSFGDFTFDKEAQILTFSKFKADIKLMSRFIPEKSLHFEKTQKEVFGNSNGFCSVLSVYDTIDASNLCLLYANYFNNMDNNSFVGIDGLYRYNETSQVWESSHEDDVKKSVRVKVTTFLDETTTFIAYLSEYFIEVEENYNHLLTSDEAKFVRRSVQETEVALKNTGLFKNSTNKIKLLEQRIVGKFEEDYKEAVNRATLPIKPVDNNYSGYGKYTETRFGLNYESSKRDNLIPTTNGFKIYNTTLSRRYIVFNNGVFDWNSLKIIPNTRDLLAIVRVERDYIPPTEERTEGYEREVEKQTKWKTYLDELLEPEDQILVQHRYAGMANPLERCCHLSKRLLMFCGSAGAGKSMFPLLMLKIFCEENRAMPSTVFTRQSDREFSNAVYRTLGSRLIPIQEFDITPRTIDTRQFKTLFDETLITIRPNYQPTMSVYLIAGFIGTSNLPPAIKEFSPQDAEAINRRMSVVKVKEKPKDRVAISQYQEVLYNECFDAIMDWVIEGMVYIRQFGEYKPNRLEAQKSPVEDLIMSLVSSEGHILTSEAMYQSLQTDMSKSAFDKNLLDLEDTIYKIFPDVQFMKERGRNSFSLVNVQLPFQPVLKAGKITVDNTQIQ